MPEERNRIEVDRIAQLLFCPDERSRQTLAAEGVPGRAEVVGDVMADATRLFAPIAPRARACRASRSRTRCSRSTGRRTRSPSGSRGSLAALGASGWHFVFPVHPRTRKVLDEHGIALRPSVEAIEPSATSRCSRSSPEPRASSPTRAACRRRRTGSACRASRCGPRPNGSTRSQAGANTLVPSPATSPQALADASFPEMRRRSTATATRRRGSRRRSVRFRRPMKQRVGDHRRGLRRRAARRGLRQGRARRPARRRRAEPSSTQLNRGESYIEDVSSESLKELVDAGTGRGDLGLRRPAGGRRDPDRAADAALASSASRICPSSSTPTARPRQAPAAGPARRARVDDLSGDDPRARSSRSSRRAASKCGADFYLAFSPERVDPGREDWTTKTTPKVVGGITEECTDAGGRALRVGDRQRHRALVAGGGRADEAAREHLPLGQHRARQRARAALRPDGSSTSGRSSTRRRRSRSASCASSPGPGLGGHCLPIDPFYLTWKAREYDFYTEFIELAGKVNENMPYFCRSLISQALNHGRERSLKGSKVLVLGVAYKADIARHARVAGAQADRAAAERRRGRLVPRPVRARARRARAEVGRARARPSTTAS